MKYNNKVLLLLVIILINLLETIPITAFAAEKEEVIAEGTYCMGDGETPLIAEERALLVAKRSAIEQIGTYVESYSAIKNNQLTDDEVKVISSGSMEVTVLDKRRTINESNIIFWVKIKATVTPDNIETIIAKFKGKYAGASNPSNTEDNNNPETLFQQGNNEMDADRYWSATKLYTAAIKLSPHFAQAYLKRGEANIKLGNYSTAIDDLTEALEDDPDLVMAYFWKGQAFEKMKNRHAAVEAYRKFINRATPDLRNYIDKAKHRLFLLNLTDIIFSESPSTYEPSRIHKPEVYEHSPHKPPPDERFNDERRGSW